MEPESFKVDSMPPFLKSEAFKLIGLSGNGCPFKLLIEGKDLKMLKYLLYECVWSRFSLDPADTMENFFAEQDSLPRWFLHAAVFTGCPLLIDFALEARCNDTSHSQWKSRCGKSLITSATRKRYLHMYNIDNDGFNDKKVMVNSRIECKFPLTDTWIHRSFKLCLSPLHLACWRLDHVSIKSLLKHGADPNIVALEESDKCSFSAFPALAKNGGKRPGKSSALPECDEVESDQQSGLCPLHFIALGIRAPPAMSLFAGIDGLEQNVLHNNIQCSNLSMCSMVNEHTSNNSNAENKSRIIADCVEGLLAAGACVNFCPPQKFLIGGNPLDTLLQPPMRIFYAPTTERGNQNPVALRRQDLTQTADNVIAACGTLLKHGASVSQSFQDLYSWRPGILDCFHLHNSEQSRQLVKYCIRLGLFSTGDCTSDNANPLRLYNQLVETAYLPLAQLFPENYHGLHPMMIRRFVADVININIPFRLASIVLSWCPFPVLVCAKKEITAVMKRTRGDDGTLGPRMHNLKGSGLAEFAEIVKELQLASLRHRCALKIQELVQFRSQSILDLPLPPPLKRRLIDLDL